MENNKRPKQCERVYQYMIDFGSITQIDALRDLGVMRLASRISEMKKGGVQIKDERVALKNRYGDTCFIKKYYLS